MTVCDTRTEYLLRKIVVLKKTVYLSNYETKHSSQCCFVVAGIFVYGSGRILRECYLP